MDLQGFPGGSVVESACQYRRRGFDPWVGKIPWRRKWQATWVFLPEKSTLVDYSPQGHKRVGHNLVDYTTTTKNGFTQMISFNLREPYQVGPIMISIVRWEN